MVAKVVKFLNFKQKSPCQQLGKGIEDFMYYLKLFFDWFVISQRFWHVFLQLCNPGIICGVRT